MEQDWSRSVQTIQTVEPMKQHFWEVTTVIIEASFLYM